MYILKEVFLSLEVALYNASSFVDTSSSDFGFKYIKVNQNHYRRQARHLLKCINFNYLYAIDSLHSEDSRFEVLISVCCVID